MRFLKRKISERIQQRPPDLSEKSVNRNQWGKQDFEITGDQVWLNTDGRKKAIQVYESRKQEKWKHPVLDYSLSYARTIELEARLLEKEWTGRPGLFAKLRLR